jgi:hypothetical protein
MDAALARCVTLCSIERGLDRKIKMRRVYYPYWEWEDYHSGMWRKVSNDEHDSFLQKAIELTSKSELYGSFMLQVLDLYPKACEHNLTDTGMNRRAWIGHAACSIAINCPEYIVREAWWLLTQEQRDKADEKAEQAIRKFETAYETKNSGICEQMALPWLS